MSVHYTYSMIKHVGVFLSCRGVSGKLFRLADANGDGRVGIEELMNFLIMVSKSRWYDENGIKIFISAIGVSLLLGAGVWRISTLLR